MQKDIHVALLGDSTIHNDSYVPTGHTVMDYVHRVCERKVHVTRYARDGAVMSSMDMQVAQVDWDKITHMVVSIGGNDLLGIRHSVYRSPVDDMEHALLNMSQLLKQFDDLYGMLALNLARACAKHDVELALCTVYRGNEQREDDQLVNETAVEMFNSKIRNICWSLDIPLIDSFSIFDDPNDFANPIEPSAQGGFKLAHAVKDFVMYRYPNEHRHMTRAVFAGVVDTSGQTFPVAHRYQSAIGWGIDQDWMQRLQEQQGEKLEEPSGEEPLLLPERVGSDPVPPASHYGYGDWSGYNGGHSYEPNGELHPHEEESWKTGGH